MIQVEEDQFVFVLQRPRGREVDLSEVLGLGTGAGLAYKSL